MTDDKHKRRSLDAIAKRLVASRKVLGYSQAEFARKAGVPSNTYNQYERAVSRPRLDYAFMLYDTYGLRLEWIYDGDPSGLPYRLAKLVVEPEQPSAEGGVAKE